MRSTCTFSPWTRRLKASEIVHYFARPDVMERLHLMKAPSEKTAQRWMHIMEYHYGRPKNGMYVDGHECEDAMEYCTKVFLPFWFSIEEWMMTWDNNNKPILLCGMVMFPQKKCV